MVVIRPPELRRRDPVVEVYKEVTLAMISPANTNPVSPDRNYVNVTGSAAVTTCRAWVGHTQV